jgi:hypothetical protein
MTSKQGNIFPKKFSKEMNKVIETQAELQKDLDKVVNGRSIAFYPASSTAKILSGIEHQREKIGILKPSDEVDVILLCELNERLRIMEGSIIVPNDTEFSYVKNLCKFGITEDDVNSAVKFMRTLDFQTIAEELVEMSGESYERSPDNESTSKDCRTLHQKLLRVTYEVASPGIKKIFPNFDEYAKTVEFGINGRSYQNKANVVLYDSNATIINIRNGLRFDRVIDIFQSAELVGEEGLLGHQGQFLVTEASNIPDFLKEGVARSSMVHAEALGDLGSARLVSEIDRNPTLTEGVKPEHLEFLRKRSRAEEKRAFANIFLNAYESYFMLESNMNAEHTLEAIYSITKSPMVRSGELKNRILARYKSPTFWDNTNLSLEKWGYLLANMLSKKIDKRLENMGAESREFILDHLQMGLWTKKGFESYFDYLVEKFS